MPENKFTLTSRKFTSNECLVYSIAVLPNFLTETTHIEQITSLTHSYFSSYLKSST